ncbi:hypothetical protein FB192DRAFT_1353694 [Mucor lusitanicus]|uniref:DUF221-domain-containing protein n=1 Tax=Mucor circinelloides f. lusitanicus TaxID=29924 RepID=A0A8H4BT29_MUCCL|nr:hypothetical protein FB192DRAFT_1353694 [Mucor lusitanicus]
MSSTQALAGFPCIWIFRFLCEDEEPLPGSPAQTSKSPTGFTTQLILCTSVGLLCFLLFCFLRVRWSAIYSPRLRMRKHAPDQLPTSFFGWILPLLRTPNSVIMDKVGLDAVVMLQFLLMSVKLFSFCGFFGTVVLYPISKMGGDIANGTYPENPGNGTDGNQTTLTFLFTQQEHFFAGTSATTTGTNINFVSHSVSFLWVYLFFTYLFVFATFYFTFLNYRDYVRIRREFLLRKAKTLSARTLLITGIPPYLRSDRKLADYFEKLGIGVVESVHTIRHVGRLLEFIKERTQHLRQLETAYTNYLGNPCQDPNYDPDEILNEEESREATLHETCSSAGADGLPTHQKQRQRPTIRQGICCGPKVDAIDYYTEKFDEIDELVVKARKVGKFLPTSVGFVTFEETISAYVASQVLIDSTPFRLRAQLAPEPRDVLWENIAMHGRERVIRKALIMFILLFLVFSWTIPCNYLSALTSTKSLKAYFPWLLKLAEKNKILKQIVAGFIPTLGVVIFFSVLPIVFNSLSVIEGFTTRSESEESCFAKQFFFLFSNVLLFITVASTLFKSQKDIFEDPTKIANIFASKLPEVAPFYINYTVLQGIMLCPIQLLQIGPILVQQFYRTFLCKTPRDYAEVFAPRMYNFGWGYPVPVFMFVVILVYSTISPLILVFGVIYFAMSYLVCKYQLLYVYFHSYEVAGRMWPLVFSRIIIGLLIFELTSAGLFTLNKSYPLAALCIPLIFLTVAYKFMMDKAYQRSTQFLPLQLLSEKLGPMTTIALQQHQPRGVVDDINVHPLMKSTPTATTTESAETANAETSSGSNTAAVAMKKNRKRRTVLDEDDYVADPRKFTDFREPPMTLLNGILNTGMKQYGHPALLGVLPQLWLPTKAGYEDRAVLHNNTHASNESSSASFSSSSSLSVLRKQQKTSSPDQVDESQPLLDNAAATTAIPTRSVNNTTTNNNIPIRKKKKKTQLEQELEEGGQTDEEEEQDNTGTYYHHPERRHSKNLLSRSYGATSSTSKR